MRSTLSITTDNVRAAGMSESRGRSDMSSIRSFAPHQHIKMQPNHRHPRSLLSISTLLSITLLLVALPALQFVAAEDATAIAPSNTTATPPPATVSPSSDGVVEPPSPSSIDNPNHAAVIAPTKTVSSGNAERQTSTPRQQPTNVASVGDASAETTSKNEEPTTSTSTQTQPQPTKHLKMNEYGEENVIKSRSTDEATKKDSTPATEVSELKGAPKVTPTQGTNVTGVVTANSTTTETESNAATAATTTEATAPTTKSTEAVGSKSASTEAASVAAPTPTVNATAATTTTPPATQSTTKPKAADGGDVDDEEGDEGENEEEDTTASSTLANSSNHKTKTKQSFSLFRTMFWLFIFLFTVERAWWLYKKHCRKDPNEDGFSRIREFEDYDQFDQEQFEDEKINERM